MAKARVLIAIVVMLVTMAACGDTPGGSPGGGGPGVRERPTKDPANAEVDEAAEVLLKDALRTANTHYFDGDDSYEGFDAAAAAEIDPEITWLDGTDPAEVGQVSITDATKTNVHMVTKSESGLYFCLRNLNQFGRGEFLTGYGAAFADVDESGDCIGEG
jgi:hypothetical protein